MSKPITKARVRLTSIVTAASTTISFTPVDTNRSLTSVTMADFGTYGFLVINPSGKANNYQVIRFTGWSVSGLVITISGLTGMTNQGDDTSATLLEFAAGTIATISTNHHWFNHVVQDEGAQTIAGVKTFSSFPQKSGSPTPTLGAELTTKTYADSLTFAGAPDASTIQKGIVEIATDAEFLAGTATGATGAVLVPSGATVLSHAAQQLSNALPMGATISAGEIVYMDNATGKYLKALATTQAHIDAIAAVAFESGVLNDYKNMLLPGSIVFGASGLGAGLPIYLSDTGTPSTTPGTIRKVIGRGLSAAIWVFNPTIDTPTATPAATKIVLSDSTSKISDGWLGLTTAGDTVYSDGTDLQRLGIGLAGQILKVNPGATAPSWSPQKLTSFTTTVTVNGITTETTLLTVSIPAGTLGIGGVIKGLMLMDSIQIGASKTLTLRLKYGATTLVSMVLTNSNVNNISHVGSLLFVLASTGAANSQKGVLRYEAAKQAIASSATDPNPTQGSGVTAGTSAEDSTLAKTFTITAQLNDVSDTLQTVIGFLDVIN